MRYAVLLAVLVFFQPLCQAADPSVDIKCNGLDSGVIVKWGTNAKIDLTVTAGWAAGQSVDIWAVMKTPFGFFSYDGFGPYYGWNYGLLNAYFTGPLADMTDTILDHSLPSGTYKASVAIDTNANGRLDMGSLFTQDSVVFIVGLFPDMVPVPGGEYHMGDHFGVGSGDELPVHPVYVDPFLMDIYEVTNQQYCDYLNSAYKLGLIEVKNGVVYKANGIEHYCDTHSHDNDSRIDWDGAHFSIEAGKEDHPMLEVSWYGAVAYANWLSLSERLIPCYDLNTWECSFGVGGYRLPTEAEWECAARGGEYTPYYKYPWGDDIDGSKANYYLSGDPYEIGPYPWTTPVGYYDGNQIPKGVDMANGYGLYDMAGNVWEWCNDWYDYHYYNSAPYDNPHGPLSGTSRVIRGGSWDYDASDLRGAIRSKDDPNDTIHNTGFRLILD